MGVYDVPSFTLALCQALILKKEVSAERFADPSVSALQATCPRDCHACCAKDVTLDLTSVEALMIYLLQKDVVSLIDRYTELHDPTEFCPFLLMDKCIIHTYKPTACQMYMPLDYKGEPVCYYLSDNKSMEHKNMATPCTLHSNAYALHGYMLLTQRMVKIFFSKNCFKNIYDGTFWWKTHYSDLPLVTRNSLEAIISENEHGLLQMAVLDFETLLAKGLSTYNESIVEHDKAC
jgi:Fe-S-cluster containining protein